MSRTTKWIHIWPQTLVWLFSSILFCLHPSPIFFLPLHSEEERFFLFLTSLVLIILFTVSLRATSVLCKKLFQKEMLQVLTMFPSQRRAHIKHVRQTEENLDRVYHGTDLTQAAARCDTERHCDQPG